MLKLNPQLLLGRGKMVEDNGRTFEDSTAIQFVAWARDWDMWEMFEQYFPKADPTGEAIKEQLAELNNKGLTYALKNPGLNSDCCSLETSKAFSFQPLIDALTAHSQMLDKWERTKWKNNTSEHKDCYDQWQRVGVQFDLLPAHVANAYCRIEFPARTRQNIWINMVRQWHKYWDQQAHIGGSEHVMVRFPGIFLTQWHIIVIEHLSTISSKFGTKLLGILPTPAQPL
jgi:hypothetical protein